MRSAAAFLFVLLALPLSSCGLGNGPQGPPPGSVGEQEQQEAMPETKLFDRNGGAGQLVD